MDHVDDDCMNMFTSDQKDKMLSTLNIVRKGLLTSPAIVTLVDDNISDDKFTMKIYPNPTNGKFKIDITGSVMNNPKIENIDLSG